MKVTGIQKTDYLSYGNRLLKEDITRLPSKETNKADFYTSQNTEPHHKSNLWRNVFTAATFALTGLYIAHRNNLFNPAKREAKRIINGEAVIQKAKDFVNSAIQNDAQRDVTYSNVAKKILSVISQDKARGQEIADEAQRTLSDENAFTKLMEKVKNRLNDVKDANGNTDMQGLKDGYTVDILDQLAVFIERHLRDLKNNGKEYKNQTENIIKLIFEPAENGTTKAGEILSEIIEKRSFGTVDKFLVDNVINRKFNS